MKKKRKAKGGPVPPPSDGGRVISPFMEKALEELYSTYFPSLWARMSKMPAVHRWDQAHIPYGTVMRRPENPDEDGPPWQHGMALREGCVLMLDNDTTGIVSYTSGWEIDPEGTPK